MKRAIVLLCLLVSVVVGAEDWGELWHDNTPNEKTNIIVGYTHGLITGYQYLALQGDVTGKGFFNYMTEIINEQYKELIQFMDQAYNKAKFRAYPYHDIIILYINGYQDRGERMGTISPRAEEG